MIISRFVHFSVALSIFLLFGFRNPVNIQQPADKKQSASVTQIATDIFRLVNAHRAGLGLKPLEWNVTESSVEAAHSSNMASGKTAFGHDGFQQRIKSIAGRVGYISASGENVAYGQMGAKEVVDTWLHSPEHKKNIEGDYSLTGIGVAKGKKGIIYFTEIFTRQD
jgi:uncharacterized protein YkwD